VSDHKLREEFEEFQRARHPHWQFTRDGENYAGAGTQESYELWQAAYQAGASAQREKDARLVESPDMAYDIHNENIGASDVAAAIRSSGE
jgi:hypothetical protein